MRRLLVNPDTPEAWAIDLEPGTLSLGRSEENDIPIEHPSISSAHCRITVRDSGIWLKDLGSTAGTFVDGELVEEVRLKPGQLIRLGEIVMRCESDVAEDKVGPQATPPLAPRIAPLPAVTAGGFCKFHPKIPGRFACLKCARAYCELCVNTRSTDGVQRKYCRHCGSECQPMQPQVQREEAPPSFLGLLPRALIYPFQGSGVILLLAGTAFFYVLGYLPFIGLILTGYLFNYAKSIVTSTAEGEDDPPDWPDFTDWKEDIIGPYFQLFALVVLSFGPSFLVAAWQAGSGTNLRVDYFIALGFGMLLAPM
ncbi:MAG: FHA domain-containing protein [Verrucomicrobia bacterium]|nr:FHA domain-containing protein [Verrucomicrobiota bacterium]